ncbi:MAG: M20/M25/M40 family metallo-hydrolase [Acidobacteriota bacterium]
MAERTPVQKTLRSSARFGLWGSFAVTTGLFLLLSPWVQRALNLGIDTEWSTFDFAAERSVQHLQALLRIDTTEQTGSELQAANYLADVVREAGIEPTVEALIEDRANFWAIIEGQSSEALVLHSHLDTDPIRQPDRWEFGPFSGEIEGPWIYGRGAFDMKSVASAQLEAFLRVREKIETTGEIPERSLILLATSSEETGSHLGAQWIVRMYPELVDRTWALLTEGGVVEATDRETIKYWGTAFAQKHFAEVWVCTRTRQRLEDLYEDLSTRGHLIDDLSLTEPAREFLRSYAPSREETSFARILSDPDSALENIEDFLFLPAYMQALFRDEVHAFPIEKDPGTQGFRMRLMVHLRPGQDLNRAMKRLLPEWMTHGLGMTVEGPFGAAASSPLDHPAYEGIQELLRERFETEATGPFFLTLYANDSRFFRGAGVPSYGFSPFLALATDAATINGPDERIALPAFVGGVDLYVELVDALLKR